MGKKQCTPQEGWGLDLAPRFISGSSVRVNKEDSEVGKKVSYRVSYASHPRCAPVLFVFPPFVGVTPAQELGHTTHSTS